MAPSRGAGLARRGIALALALVFASWTSSVQAEGPRRDRVYMAELAMVLEGARRVLLWAEAHAGDQELSRFAYPLTEHYVQMAGRMSPGTRFQVVHPHLLLVVENIERALDAAARGDLSTFRQRSRTVREELATLDGVLKHLKVRLPEPAR